jgi:2',3'-cyclic-nucleotide 2'-phosphodiesterase (5'-nucleotidase family)
MKILATLLFVVSVVFSAGSVTAHAQGRDGTTEIVILHTNDMHARIDNMGRLAYLAKRLRKTHRYVFLVAAGDNFTGNPIVDMYPDKGYPMIDLMNHCGFNLSAFGNHEFDLGQTALNKRIKQANFPFICCNVDATGAVLHQPKPYFILKAGKIRIPMLGVLELGPNGLPDTNPSGLAGLKFVNGIEKAEEYRWLKKKYGILIGLTHLGVEEDEQLARAMPELDLIIGGHSHTVIKEPMMVGKVPIVQTGSMLKYVGMITLKVRNRAVVDFSYRLIPLDTIAQSDPVVQTLIDKYNDNEVFNRVVGYAEAPLEGVDELGSLMTDAITHRLKIDFAFENVGGIRMYSLPEGPINLKEVYQLDPFGDVIVRYKMNRDEIKSLICNAYNRKKQIDLEVSGMTYTVLTDKDRNCSDVKLTDMSGRPLAADKTYSVGLNSYIAASYSFDHTDPGTSTAITSSGILIDYLKEMKRVNYSGVKRVDVKQIQ